MVRLCGFIAALTLLLLPGTLCFAQHEIPGVITFSITTDVDTVDFIKADSDLETEKPTIVFLVGSLPIPLIITDGENYSITGLSNFNYPNICNKYNFVLISKPYTPLVAHMDQLNNNYCYIPDPDTPNEVDERYSAANYLENYVRRSNAVLEFLRQQPWVKKDEIIILGHSQGATEAISLAQDNPDIAAVAYFCGNPLGRFSEFITEQINACKTGAIDETEAFANIDKLYSWWQQTNRDRPDSQCGDSSRTWISFSQSQIQAITKLEMPVYIAYGTKDTKSAMSVYLPIHMELAGKTNYYVNPFIGRGHNFESFDKDGRPNFDDMQWDDVVTDFLEWFEQHNCVSAEINQ